MTSCHLLGHHWTYAFSRDCAGLSSFGILEDRFAGPRWYIWPLPQPLRLASFSSEELRGVIRDHLGWLRIGRIPSSRRSRALGRPTLHGSHALRQMAWCPVVLAGTDDGLAAGIRASLLLTGSSCTGGRQPSPLLLEARKTLVQFLVFALLLFGFLLNVLRSRQVLLCFALDRHGLMLLLFHVNCGISFWVTSIKILQGSCGFCRGLYVCGQIILDLWR
mmetsp:Transcript_145134/g.253267  ORF Transcript_145134/g.253267 Transcript_145134/m.253267 type:complete len:219 (-) Transcript_145134:171-827(-)